MKKISSKNGSREYIHFVDDDFQDTNPYNVNVVLEEYSFSISDIHYFVHQNGQIFTEQRKWGFVQFLLICGEMLDMGHYDSTAQNTVKYYGDSDDGWSREACIIDHKDSRIDVADCVKKNLQKIIEIYLNKKP